jgi:HECT-domain (ubiquitin-transferase)/SPRY domain
VRRSVRQLAVIEYCGDDSAQSESAEDDEIDNSIGTFDKGKNDDHDKSLQPDARLTSFLSGLLLSDPVLISQQNRACLMESLFEAWSVGLLSASAPWRMVCALTASGILNMAPTALIGAVNSVPALQRYYSRLPATVARRVWAERAAVPVCSRYVQSLVELLASVRSALAVSQPSTSFLRVWKTVEVDAAMPIPFGDSSSLSFDKSNRESTRTATDFSNWEWANGWLSNDSGWEVWTGCAEFVVVDWKSPSRSAVRTLMDGGEGPPMLREGCTVMRGLDWGDGDEDGKSEYETEKGERESEREKKAHDQAVDEADPADPHQPVTDDDQDPVADSASQDSIAHVDNGEATAESDGKEQAESQSDARPSLAKKKKRKKVPNPKLPTGTVLSVEEWNGIPAMGRRVRWDRTGKEGIYRYGGDGGRYDICHVDVNDKFTRVRKRHPVPESAEQCASRHGFGAGKKYSMLLRLRVTEQVFDIMAKSTCREGILEWPDFGAGVRVNCILNTDGSVTIEEKELLYGSKDSGWEARFGQPSYVPNTTIVLSSSASSVSAQYQAEMDTKSSFLSMYEELLGSSSHLVHLLRNRTDGGRVRVTTEMQLLRGRRSSKDRVAFDPPGCPPPLRFDRDFHAASMSLSRDGRTATCVSSEGRGTAFASTGFTKGLHYWEVKLEQADIGSVFIGVAEKPSGSGSGSSFGNDSPPRLNRWLGWGFVNFRATYASGAERVYGAHCHNDDTVGVLLDCDAGRVSFFYDGLKYGEHILNDLGCAFENISPFGFNADGCGSGGAGQGAPSAVEGARTGRYPAHGAVRPRALWPVIGLRNPGDRVTFSTKWMTSLGVDSSSTLRNALAVDEVLSSYDLESHSLPEWFVAESFQEFKRWESGRWYRTETRATGPHRLAGFGLDVEVDASPIACAAASAGLGLRRALLHGDRVVVKRSAGRILELSEEAIILGAYQGRLYYRIVSQKSEGGSLTEGGGRAWFWDESEAVNDSLQLVGPGRGLEIDLPLIDRFTCLSTGGLRIVYKGGAVVRSDVEIFDRSQNIGVIGYGTVIPQQDVLERRVNSCGVVRYRIRYEGLGEGWISSRIRGGKEEPIVEPVHDDVIEKEQKSRFPTPMHAARAWYETYKKSSSNVTGLRRDLPLHGDEFSIKDLSEFEELVSCLSPGTTSAQLDKVVASLVGVIADFSESGDAVECSFTETTTVVSYAIASSENKRLESENGGNPGANEAAAAILACQNIILSPKMIIARMAILRAFNRRIRLALPWLSVRPSQEGTAILGGLCGHGASPERAGRQKLSTSMDLWVQVPSIASRIRTHRGLIFGSVKRMLLDSITFATTTPTPLSHDEYELPREIRTVRVNRLKARRAMASSDSLIKRKHSVFSQLQNETRSWGGAALRRGFVAKGHGGQKRAFKVKLVGEGVNDYSGPYREVFTDALREVLEAGENGYGVLGVLDPTPNKASQLGENRDLHMFSRSENDLSLEEGWRSEEELRIKRSFSILTTSRDESSREVAEALAFLGRLVGTACRHGIPVELPLSMNSVWKPIVEENTEEVESLREIDLLASRQYMSSPLDCPPLLWWQRRMLNSFVDGLSNVLPVEILTLLSGEELQDIICGNPDVDVDLLRRVVEYEGYEESDSVISFFWEALREMTTDERKKFLQFVWARNRLPNKESDFEAPFKIMRGPEKMSDETLPSASTCFFSLTLPCYSSKDILKRKLLFAIENVCTMESDYVTNDAEVGEGWRGL